ncbi:hypothetical protein B0T11DRAFT_52319 [Plectosphaerella cucumerina]|uniref:Uncharacterized protein n=1 Tax=Plectosphaerella cucumerina TaxID=40658 RepID=A0A8K0TKL3_9PEZI|nr:hypothetical protein B0T11DRAFT_52319 [Plectosphaerella cucumerina]
MDPDFVRGRRLPSEGGTWSRVGLSISAAAACPPCHFHPCLTIIVPSFLSLLSKCTSTPSLQLPTPNSFTSYSARKANLEAELELPFLKQGFTLHHNLSSVPSVPTIWSAEKPPPHNTHTRHRTHTHLSLVFASLPSPPVPPPPAGSHLFSHHQTSSPPYVFYPVASLP